MMIGFKPDNVKLTIHGDVMNLNKIIVAISTNTLSRNGDYKALLNPDILI
jgi:stage II sporulation protein GA (sporulation sigma-E factor processing peptidase)